LAIKGIREYEHKGQRREPQESGRGTFAGQLPEGSQPIPANLHVTKEELGVEGVSNGIITKKDGHGAKQTLKVRH